MAKSNVETRRALASVTATMSVEDNFVNIDAKNKQEGVFYSDLVFLASYVISHMLLHGQLPMGVALMYFNLASHYECYE